MNQRQAQRPLQAFKTWLFLLMPARLLCVVLSFALSPGHVEGLLKLWCVVGFVVVSFAGFVLWTTIQKTVLKAMTVPMIVTEIIAIVVILPILLSNFKSSPPFHIL